MSKMSNHAVRLREDPFYLDKMIDLARDIELEQAAARHRDECPWEYSLTDEQLDAMDAPDGPLAGFDCWGGGE